MIRRLIDWALLLHRTFPRRDAYLFTWAIGYISFSTYFFSTGSWWSLFFGLVGLFTLGSSFTSVDRLKSASFGLLTALSLMHAMSYFFDFPGLGVSLPIQMSMLWFVVGLIHVLVAGWPNARNVGVQPTKGD